jgi:hypothetical protein
MHLFKPILPLVSFINRLGYFKIEQYSKFMFNSATGVRCFVTEIKNPVTEVFQSLIKSREGRPRPKLEDKTLANVWKLLN